MPEKLTPRQKEVLGEIKDFMRSESIAPSVRDLASRLDVTPSTVHKFLRTLAEKGYIELRQNISRGIILTDERGGAVSVPILGSIPAGSPVISEELYDGYIELDSSIAAGPESFALRVKGDSMTGANILDGDMAIITRRDTADSGEIVAALLDGETTLKRFAVRSGKPLLLPENDDYDPIDLEHQTGPVRILGVLTAVVRKY